MNKTIDYSGKTIGKYYLISKIGNGSFGVVYKALDRVLSVEKAIKILEVSNPNEAYKLFSEAAIPYKCTHNNIVKINNGELINFNAEIVFVVDMELINGSSVEEILKRTEASVLWSINIIRNLLFAVEYSHIQGNIHRDIKPANILIDNGIPKLSDFGLASALGSVIIPWKWYRTHAAPETFVNNSIATVQTDIFAIGMTLYRMVNGISDWNLFLSAIPNVENLIRSGKLIDKLPKSPIVPDKVYRIIKKACNKCPEKRYSSATEMRNAIEKAGFSPDCISFVDDTSRDTATAMIAITTISSTNENPLSFPLIFTRSFSSFLTCLPVFKCYTVTNINFTFIFCSSVFDFF